MFRIIAIAQAAFICLSPVAWQAQACAETVSVPFGWKTGQIRHYQVTSRVERTGDLQGGNCTLNGQLRVEIVQRDKTTAHVRFILSALEFEEGCTAPSVRQSLWTQLAGVPINAVIEPIESKVALQNLDDIRGSIFQAIERTRVWGGRTISLNLRKEITKQLQTIFATNSRFETGLGFVEPFVVAVGGSYDTQSSNVIRTTLPSPFGDADLPASVTTTVKKSADATDDIMLSVTAIFDQEAYAAWLNNLVRRIIEGSAVATEHSALSRAGQGVRYAIDETQRVERTTGWFVESRGETTITYSEGVQNEILRLVYQPCVGSAATQEGISDGCPVTATDSKCAEILALSKAIDNAIADYAAPPKKVFVSSKTQDAFLLKYADQVLAKILQTGTHNIPKANGKTLYGSAVILVEIRSDGSIATAEIVKPNPDPRINKSLLEIILKAAPFSPFPPEIRENRMVITRSVQVVPHGRGGTGK